jgi:hypothetical protein
MRYKTSTLQDEAVLRRYSESKRVDGQDQTDLNVLEPQDEPVAPWFRCVRINSLDAFVIHDTGIEVRVNGHYDQFHFCLRASAWP